MNCVIGTNTTIVVLVKTFSHINWDGGETGFWICLLKFVCYLGFVIYPPEIPCPPGNSIRTGRFPSLR